MSLIVLRFRPGLQRIMKLRIFFLAALALTILWSLPSGMALAFTAIPEREMMACGCQAGEENAADCQIGCPEDLPEAGFEDCDWPPDIIAAVADLTLPFPFFLKTGEELFRPATFYGQLPLKPPKSA